MRYSILDPTGNLTALVESPVEVPAQPAAAAAILARHPAVEQVGFLSQTGDGLALRMAGGEFCGNAAMSAAALALLRRGEPWADGETVPLRVSGAAQPVAVRLRRAGDACFRAGVHMPAAREIRAAALSCAGKRGAVPVVQMEGISHVLIEPDSVFWPLLADHPAAERAAIAWCAALSAAGLGLMFFDRAAGRLTPLVYVPGSGTVFWENACASGTAAVGMALAANMGSRVELTLAEPGGSLRVVSDPAPGETWLYGQTRLVQTYETEI